MAYTYYASIEIQNGKVADDHVDFPIRVSGTFDGTAGEADLRTVGNGGHIQNTDAGGGVSGAYTVPADFVFSPNDDGSAEYDFEIEFYDAATGEIVAWVEIPTMDADADLTFYMVYGDVLVVNSQEDVAGTWNAGYKAVYHMAEANGNILDSSGNGHDSVAVANTPDYQQAGQAGYSINFDDPNKLDNDAENFEINHHADFAFADDFTLEAWGNPDVVDADGTMIYHYDAGSGDGISLGQSIIDAGVWLFVWWVGGVAKLCQSDNPPTAGWEYIAGIRDTNVGKIYVDGAAQADTETLAGAIDSSDPVYIGSNRDENYGLSGYEDEVRISNVARSANWILTTFNTIDDVSTFLIFGGEIIIGGTVIDVPLAELEITGYAPTVTATDTHRVMAKLSGVWTDITSAVIGDITGHWGMMTDDPAKFMADSGSMTMTMNNESGIYTPGLTTTLGGWDKGTPIMIRFQVDSTSRRRLYGTIESFGIPKKPFSEKYIRVRVADWLDYAAIHPLIGPAVQVDKTGNQLMTTILGNMPINPLNTDFSIGVNEFEHSFDTTKMKTKAYGEMSKVAVSELGYVYLIKDPIYGETLVFESANDRNGLREPVITIDNTMASLEVEYGKNVINRFANIANPRYIEAGITVLFALGSPVYIPMGGTISVRGNYTDADGGNPAVGANMIASVITTDYLMNSKKDGTGVNISADLAVVQTYGAAGVEYDLINGSTRAGWVIKLQARGYMVFKYNTLEQEIKDTDSQDLYGIIEKKINQKYQKDVHIGSHYSRKIIDEERNPRLKLKKVNFIANRSDALMEAWLSQDIGDLVYIKETVKEVDAWCFIQGISFAISPTGLIHFTWIVRDFVHTLNHGLELVQIEQGTTATDGLHFGYIPQVSGDAVVARTVSAWIYVDNIPALPDANCIHSCIDAFNGISFHIFDSDPAADGTLAVTNARASAQWGYWASDDSVIEAGESYHVAFTLEFVDVDDNPILYLNGVAITTNETQAPLGVINSEVGAEFLIGNTSTIPGQELPFKGTIDDLRVYDVILTPAEIATLESDGIGGVGVVRGIVFQGPCIRTADRDYFEDHTLVAKDSLIDNMYGMRGTKSGTVITRLIP